MHRDASRQAKRKSNFKLALVHVKGMKTVVDRFKTVVLIKKTVVLIIELSFSCHIQPKICLDCRFQASTQLRKLMCVMQEPVGIGNGPVIIITHASLIV